MKVFISWSGERSRLVGELLDEWLQCVIQAINPWRSDRDIDRGSLWFTQIANQLQDTSIGVVCITQENKDNPWILFESGALAKGLSTNRVCTFLIDLEPSDIRDPLAQFNHTKPDEAGVKSLVRTLNSTLEEKSLPDKIIDQVFDTYWPQFETKFKAIIKSSPQQVQAETRTKDDILSELLYITRSMDKRIRDIEYKEDSNKKIVRKPIRTEKTIHIMDYIDALLDKGFTDELIIMNVMNNFEISEESAKGYLKNAQNMIK